MRYRTLGWLVLLLQLTLVAGQLRADPLYTLRLFNTDDTLQAFVTNSTFSSQLILTNNFLGDTGFVNISPFLSPGTNIIELRLTNEPGGGGYTYGYDLRQDGITLDAGSCGTVNVLGCNGNDSATGTVFGHTTTFGLPALTVPSALRLRLFNTDDTLQAFVSNSDFTDELILTNNFKSDTGFVDISSFTRPGHNHFDLSLVNNPGGGGYTYGFQFLNAGDFTIVDEGFCGTVNVVGCNSNNLAVGTVFTHRLIFGDPQPVSTVPEPGTLLLVGVGLAGLSCKRKKRPYKA